MLLIVVRRSPTMLHSVAANILSIYLADYLAENITVFLTAKSSHNVEPESTGDAYTSFTF